jgi:exopolysaccharide biosynthesis polyprenyl glycosylphosphotransferase
MPRFVDRHVAPEMLALLLLEMALSFSLTYAVLAPEDFGSIHVMAANHAAVLTLTIGFTSFLLGLYRPQLFMRTRSLLLNTALGGVLAFPAAWMVSAALDMNSSLIAGPDRVWPTKILIIWIAALFAVRLGFLVAVRSKVFVRRVVIVGAPGDVAGTVATIRAGRAGFFEVALPPHINCTPRELRAAGIRNALISRPAFDALSETEKASYDAAGVDLEPETEFWERHLKRLDIDHLTSAWFAELDASPPGRVQAFLNRTGDIAISTALLVFTLPLMLLVALVVRLDSPGAVLYRQERVGLNGKTFVLLKFRSMNSNAEARGPAWAQQRDPRVTRVGSLMRRTRIDELPQLLNVLRGEMSFIGPRPERPHFVEQLAELIPHYRERARVKPGLTGWAQVNYPYGASVEDAKAKLSYDLFYVQNRSPMLDLLIMFATVRVILFQEGAR